MHPVYMSDSFQSRHMLCAIYRKVRQESQLWTELHQGLLTTGKLNAALGFYEPAAAKRLGIPTDRVNHGALLSAAANLQQPSYGLQLLSTAAAPVISVQASSTVVPPPPPGLQSAIAASEYEAAAIKLADANAANGVISKSKRARMRKQQKALLQQQQQQQQQQQASAASKPGSADTAMLTSVNPTQAAADPYATEDGRRRRCTTVAARGRSL